MDVNTVLIILNFIVGVSYFGVTGVLMFFAGRVGDKDSRKMIYLLAVLFFVAAITNIVRAVVM